MNVAAKQECREGSSSTGSATGKSAVDGNDKPGDGNGTESCLVQHPASDSSAGGGRKRRAAEMDGAAHTERSHASAHSGARSMLEANGVTSEGTPTTLRRSAEKTKLQQPAWSPLDKLCDLASTFQK